MKIGKRTNKRRILHTHFIDRLALINSLVSGVALFPQGIKVLSTGNSAGVSSVTAILIWINSLVWLAYGLHRGLISVVLSAVLNTIAATLLIIALTIY